MMIAVVGAAQCDDADRQHGLSEVGRRLAERDAIVVCGGRGGVMAGRGRRVRPTAGGVTSRHPAR